MQTSIFKIFGTIKSISALALLLVLLLTATILSEYTSFYKLENLQKEKELATAVYNLGRDDLDLSNIQYRGNNTMLRYEGEALSGFYEYDYVNKFSKTDNYSNDLSKLQYAINDFNVAAGQWYTQEQVSEEELLVRQEQFSDTYNTLMQQINVMTTKNINFEERRFLVQVGLVNALLLLMLYSAFWISGRLNLIQNDLKSLHSLEQNELSELATTEADMISKQLSRTVKAPAAQNPAYLDIVTGINNNKGFMHEYGEKKSQKIGNYTAVCIFSVDKLGELEMQYTQEIAETILKKVSFMLSLYRQHNDVIGRIEHNQFAIMLSRQDKTSAINDCELIRKSVEETPFKTSDGQDLTVTLSGGFVQKTSVQPLAEVITKANKVLSMSIQHGGNRIAQLRDKASTYDQTASLK